MRAALHMIVFIGLAGALQAQDADLLFAGRSTLLLDPSRAGFQPGIGATLIHQDHWLQMPDGWRTDLLAVEWCGRNSRKQVDSWFGLGIMAARDRHGNVGSRFSTAGLMPAMHLRSGHRSFLSAGLEVRWVNDLIGDGSGAWASQYDGSRYDASIISGEAWNTDAQTWIEARAGLSWTLKQNAESRLRRERDVLVIGIAADHLGQILLDDSSAPTSPVPMRFTAYALGEAPHEIWDNGFFAGELIGHLQGPFHSARFNIYAGKHLWNTSQEQGGPMPIGFKVGLGYRYQDALLVNAAIDIGNLTFGLGYGWAVINRNTMAAGRRSFEMMVQFRTGS